MSNTCTQKSTTSKAPAVSMVAGAGAAFLTVVAVLAGQSAAFAAEAPVDLGTAGSYSVLGGQTVTNTGPSRLDADLGVSPGSAVTEFPPGVQGGSVNAGNAQAAQAQADVTIAYDDAASRTPTESITADLVGRTLVPGVYESTEELALSGELTLDAQDDPNAVFIFQAASKLTIESASSVNLTGGAQACNVYWQVGSSATLGTNSSFAGTILALESISAATGADVEGRALARNGAVTLDNNTFTAPDCAPDAPGSAPVPTETAPVPTGSATASPVPTETETATATAPPVPTETAPASETPEGSVTETTEATPEGTNRGINIDSAASTGTPSAVTVLTGTAAVLAVLAAAFAIMRRTSRKS